MDIHWYNEREWKSWRRGKKKITLVEDNDCDGHPSLDRTANIERVTRMLTCYDNRRCQAEGHHRLRRFR